MRAAHVNRLNENAAPYSTEFTDGVTAGLEVGLIEVVAMRVCACVYEFAMFTRRDATLVWTWRRIAGGCGSHA